MDSTVLAHNIVDAVGGIDNIKSVAHCVTRLRFILRNESSVDTDSVKAIAGVLGVVSQSGQYQVVIGPAVADVYDEVLKLGVSGNGEVSVDADGTNGEADKKTPIDAVLDTISGIFVPIIPALVGAGMIQALMSLLTFAGIDTTTNEYQILNCFGQATFYFLPLLLAHAAAVKLGTNPYVAMGTVGALLIPQFASLVSGATEAGASLSFLGLPVGLVSYSSTVFPALLIVLAECFVEKLVRRIVPAVVSSIFVPMLTMLIMIPLAVVALGPLGTYAGDLLYMAVTGLYAIVPWLVPAVVGAITPLCIMTGMHFAGLIPITVQLLATSGFDSAVGPGMICSNFAIGGACLAVFILSKKADTKSLGFSVGLQSILGVCEPAMYGVLIPMRTPFVASVIGGTIGGLVSGLLGVGRFAQAGNSIFSWTSYIGGESMMNFWFIIATCILAFIVALICGLALKIKED